MFRGTSRRRHYCCQMQKPLYAICLVGMLCTVLRAQSSWQVISSPNADYVTGTSKLLITGPDNIPVQNFADGTIQASFLQFPDTTFTLTLSTKTVGVSWPNWSSPPDSESSTPRCLDRKSTRLNSS